MTWPGLLIRVLSVVWFAVVTSSSRAWLGELGIEPNVVARIVWNIVLVVPALMLALSAAKRVDGSLPEKWKI